MAGQVKIRALTKAEIATFPKSVIVPLARPFTDDRGGIQPLVDRMMESAVMITSNKGSVRADHYHRTDWHYCYVIDGQIEYYHRPHGSTAKAEKVIIKPGQLFFTPPMVDHTMVFLKNTMFLTLGRNSRAQEVYEADVVRVPSLKD